MSAPSPPYLSIVIPVYNERESLRQLVAEIDESLCPSQWSYEVLLVDDGSTDGSAERLLQMGRDSVTLRPVLLGGNLGQSAALSVGLGRVRGEVVVTMDGDLQNDPSDIPRVVEALSDADVVSGVRIQRKDAWRRRVASRIANAVRRAFTRDGLTDVGCSLKAYRSEFLSGVPIFDGVHRFLPALVKANGARVIEIPVAHRPREHGVSKYTIGGRLWRGVADLFGVCWLLRRWVGQVDACSSRPGAKV